MNLLPTTTTGRIAARLLAACAAIFLVAIVVSLVAGARTDDSSFDIYRLIVGTALLLTAVGALIAGLVAVVRDRERSLVAFVAIAAGLLAIAFVLGDIVFGTG